MYRLLLILSLSLWNLSAWAFSPKVEKVTEQVYAIVGELDQRSPENQGLNNTSGFIITDEGVVLVGSGATEGSAKLLEAAVKSVTDKPIRHVINIGVQDHHWMGNAYFIQQNIPVLALARTVESQHQQEANNRQRLAAALKIKPDSLKVAYATQSFPEATHAFNVGKTKLELRYLGDGHFPGDALLWLPDEKILFTGDLVFNERMLGVLPDISKVKAWQATFKSMCELKPQWVIAGHGKPSDLANAQKNTGDYLDWLVTEVSKAVDNLEDLSSTVDRLAQEKRFDYLALHESLHRKNIHQTYLQLEQN